MNPAYANFAFPTIATRSWDCVFRKGVSAEALSLLTALLQYDPEARVRPLEACAHRFFNELREESTRLMDGQMLPELFNLTRNELRVCLPSLREKVIPSWHPARLQSSSTSARLQTSSSA